MYETDYILRLIEEVGAALRRVLGALRERRPEDAVDAADEAVRAALGAPAVLAYSLTVEGLLTMLSAGGTLDVGRAITLAEVLDAKSRALDALGRRDEAGDLLRRAGALRIAAAVEAGEDAVAELRASLLATAERGPDTLASEGDGL